MPMAPMEAGIVCHRADQEQSVAPGEVVRGRSRPWTALFMQVVDEAGQTGENGRSRRSEIPDTHARRAGYIGDE